MTTAHLLWGLLRYRPWLTLLNLTLAVAIAAIDLAPGPLMRAYFDGLSGAAPAGLGVEASIWLLLLTALVRTVVKTHAVLVFVLHGFVVNALVRRNLLGAIFARPGADALPVAPGDALNGLRDDAEQAGRLVGEVIDGLSLLLFTAGALAVMLRIDARLTLVVFLPLAGIVAVAQRAAGRLQTYRQASRRATGRVAAVLGELFEAVQAVQLADAGRHAIAHLDRLNEQRRRLALRDAVLGRVLEAVFANTVNLGTGLILLLAGASMRAGDFTIGDFALFAYYLTWVSSFIQSVGGLLAQYRQTGVAVARLAALTPDQPRVGLIAPHPLGLRGPLPAAPLPARRPADRLERLEVVGLSYRHPSTGRGIAGVSFAIERGQVIVVTGPVGAGKTTLLRALLGLLPRDAGEIRWNGDLVADPAAFLVPPRAAYTPQAPRLFSESLADNILLGLPEAAVDLPGAVRAAVLEADVAGLPDGLATVVGPRGVRLSGGQVQRAAAARMLVRAPDLIVVDDLSSALDVRTERQLWERLFRRPETTALIVSHRRAVLERADQILVLEEGALAAAGPLPALLAADRAFQRLWQDDAEPEIGCRKGRAMLP